MSLSPNRLRCEYLTNPLGVDSPKPRLSWQNPEMPASETITAYQVMVASSKDLLLAGTPDMWDSGKIVGNSDFTTEYSGKKLDSGCRYYWTVRCWNSKNVDGPLSQPAFFETGLRPEEWQGKWITKPTFEKFFTNSTVATDKNGEKVDHVWAAYFRKDFQLNGDIKSARAYISGLGLYELRVNGHKIGDRVLDPGCTDYDQTALYATYDITAELTTQNAIGVIVGNGNHIKKYGFDDPKLIVQVQINFVDGQRIIIATSPDWKVTHGPLRENGIYFGENYDARLEMTGWDRPNFDASAWENAIFAPNSPLSANMGPAIRVTQTLKPKQIFNPTPGVFVADFGQNFAGWVRLNVSGPAGTSIKLHFGELCHSDGSLNANTAKGAEATDTYILNGQGNEIWEPRFTYHGFRYVEICGFPGVPTAENITGCVVHSDVPDIGTFSCSNDLLNRIHTAIRWTQLSSLKSIPTDSPQRNERQGWLGDAALSAEQAILNFDMAAFYTKFVDDIQAAVHPDGSLSDVVPSYWHQTYPCDPSWGTAYLTISWFMYWYNGDKRILEKNYDNYKKYLAFLATQADNHILRHSGKYGDWCPPGSVAPKKTPVELTATWHYQQDVERMAKVAEVLDQPDDVKKYSQLAVDIRKAFNAEFFKNGMYEAKYVSAIDRIINQTANTLPLWANFVAPDKKEGLLARIIESVARLQDYHLDTGIIGTRYIMEMLSENGHTDIAYQVATQKSYPSWGYMLEEGATTIWERWEKMVGPGINSHNHIMLGTVDGWFYKHLAGITCQGAGWSKIDFQPFLGDDLKYVTAAINTVRGRTEINWHRIQNCIEFKMMIPTGATARLKLPVLSEKCILTDAKSSRPISAEVDSKEILVFNLTAGTHFLRFTY